jgi:hypothetical protein
MQGGVEKHGYEKYWFWEGNVFGDLVQYIIADSHPPGFLLAEEHRCWLRRYYDKRRLPILIERSVV